MRPGRAGADFGGDAPGLNPTLVAISLGLHLLGFGLAVGLPRLMSGGGPGSPVYVVDLVSFAPGKPAVSPAPAGGAPVPKKAVTPPPRPEKSIKLPEPNTKKQEKKKPEPKKPEAKPALEAPAARAKDQKPTESKPAGITSAPGGAGEGTSLAGAAGGTGTGQADAVTFYAGLLKRRIEGAWLKPLYPQNWAGPGDPTASVRIVLTGSGRVSGLDVVVPSGYEAMDRSILRAVQDAQPFPPFPVELGRDSLTVKIDFVLPPAIK